MAGCDLLQGAVPAAGRALPGSQSRGAEAGSRSGRLAEAATLSPRPLVRWLPGCCALRLFCAEDAPAHPHTRTLPSILPPPPPCSCLLACSLARSHTLVRSAVPVPFIATASPATIVPSGILTSHPHIHIIVALGFPSSRANYRAAIIRSRQSSIALHHLTRAHKSKASLCRTLLRAIDDVSVGSEYHLRSICSPVCIISIRDSVCEELALHVTARPSASPHSFQPYRQNNKDRGSRRTPAVYPTHTHTHTQTQRTIIVSARGRPSFIKGYDLSPCNFIIYRLTTGAVLL